MIVAESRYRGNAGLASAASLDNPHDLKLSPNGKFLYVSDVGNDRIAIPFSGDFSGTFLGISGDSIPISLVVDCRPDFLA